MMNSKAFFISILTLAIGFLCAGLYFLTIAFLTSGQTGSEFGASLISVSGVLFFGAALVYQIREYGLQVVELHKSVEAQEETARAMTEQKELLIEQNTQVLVFTMVEGLNRYKDKDEVQMAIKQFYDEYGTLFRRELEACRSKAKEGHLISMFAESLRNLLSHSLREDKGFVLTKRVVQLVYNVLYLISQRLGTGEKDWFTPYVYSQLSEEEMVMIHLFNLVPFGVPLSNQIEWRRSTVDILFKMIEEDPENLISRPERVDRKI